MKLTIDHITRHTGPAQAGFSQTYRIKAHSSLHTGDQPVEVLIAVDWEALASQLATRCLENKTRKTRVLRGDIRAWVKNDE
jgi:hypothetical protein